MKKYLFLALAVAALVVTLCPLPASADPGLRVTGIVLVANVTPGETITHEMTVGIRETDPAMDIVVEVKDWTSYSARDFIVIDQPSFHLEPGQEQKVTATITIPPDVGDGGRYALIKIAQKPVSGGGAQTLAAIDVPIVLTIKDSQLIHTGRITDLTVAKVVSGQPIVITTTVENTGNHHYKVKAELTILNAKQKVLGTNYTPVTTSSIKPSLSGQIQGKCTPQRKLGAGNYTVRSRVMLEDGSVLDEAESRFELTEPYIPPGGAPAGVNWLVIGVVAGVIVIALVIFSIVRRRQRHTS